jgi:hypothetical protein
MMKRLIVALALVTSPSLAFAQGRGGPPQPPRSPKDAAPVDLTGYWVSLVTEDWRWRMVTPLKGDSASVPLNPAAKKVMAEWDPAKDEAAGNQCRAYGAAAIMRMPGRLHITWQDENTLKVETDAGTQTRNLRFLSTGSGQTAAAPKEAPSWQGSSVARWEQGLTPLGGQLPLGLGPRQSTRSRSLEVVTTNLKPGYLRKNGVPYSDKTTVTEYFERFTEPDGNDHLMVMTVVTDPEYLALPFVVTTDFKHEADGSKWDPTPCSAR